MHWCMKRTKSFFFLKKSFFSNYHAQVTKLGSCQVRYLRYEFFLHCSHSFIDSLDRFQMKTIWSSKEKRLSFIDNIPSRFKGQGSGFGCKEDIWFCSITMIKTLSSIDSHELKFRKMVQKFYTQYPRGRVLYFGLWNR